MNILWWQILLLTLYAGYQILDELQIYSSLSAPVFAGLFAGLVMGDIKAGLIIGLSGVPPKLMLTQARFLPQHFLCL